MAKDKFGYDYGESVNKPLWDVVRNKVWNEYPAEDDETGLSDPDGPEYAARTVYEDALMWSAWFGTEDDEADAEVEEAAEVVGIVAAAGTALLRKAVKAMVVADSEGWEPEEIEDVVLAIEKKINGWQDWYWEQKFASDIEEYALNWAAHQNIYNHGDETADGVSYDGHIAGAYEKNPGEYKPIDRNEVF